MLERESTQSEMDLANDLFVWLQESSDELPPHLSLRTGKLLDQLSVDRSMLPELKSFVDDLEEAYILPLRVYIAGFEEKIVRQLDAQHVFDKARRVLEERCSELFTPSVPAEQEMAVEVEEVSEPVDIPSIVEVVAIRGMERKRNPVSARRRLANRAKMPIEKLDDFDVSRLLGNALSAYEELLIVNVSQQALVAKERQRVEIVRRIAAGETQTAIADSLNTNQAVVSKLQTDLLDRLASTFADFSEEEWSMLIQGVVTPEKKLELAVRVGRIGRSHSKSSYTRTPRAPREEQSHEPSPEDLAVIEHEEESGDIEQSLGDVRLDTDLVKQYLREAGKFPLLNAVQEVEISRAIEVGLLAAERLEKRDDTLSDEEREELEYLIEQGRINKELMLNSNLRLVVSITKRYTGRGMQFLDLIQEGNLGLVRAMEKFDYTKGYKFSTYATWWIRQATSRALADQGRTIRIPVHMFEVINKVNRVQRQMLQDLGREPTPDELAKQLDMKIEKVLEVQKYGRQPISLSVPLGEDGDSEFGDLIEDSDAVDIADQMLTDETSAALRNLIETFTEREATVIGMRTGLFDGRQRTLDEVAQVIGVSKQRVQQIEKKTLSKLRHPSRAYLLAGLKRSRDS